MTTSHRMKEAVASASQSTRKMSLTTLMTFLPILNSMRKPVREVFMNALIEKSEAEFWAIKKNAVEKRLDDDRRAGGQLGATKGYVQSGPTLH
jgi:hypothetical protein